MHPKYCIRRSLFLALIFAYQFTMSQTIDELVEISPTTFDFGQVKNWANQKATFTLHNGSDKTLHFLRTPSTPSINILYPTHGIPPGDSVAFYVEYFTGQKGKFDEVVTLFFEEFTSAFPVIIKGHIVSFSPNVVSVCPAYRSSASVSTSNLSLFVRDKSTDRPLKNVRVRLKSRYFPGEIIMTTNEDGKLNENFPLGSFDMTLERDGYLEQSMHFDHTYRSDVIQISMERSFDENDVNYDSLLVIYDMKPLDLEDPIYTEYGLHIMNIVTKEPIYRADVFMRNQQGYLLESGKSNKEGFWLTWQPTENTKAEIEADGYEDKVYEIDATLTGIQEVYLTPIYEGVLLEKNDSASQDSTTSINTAQRDNSEEVFKETTSKDLRVEGDEKIDARQEDGENPTIAMDIENMSPEERMEHLLSSSAIETNPIEDETSFNAQDIPEYNKWGELNEDLFKQNNLIFLIDVSFSMRKHGKIAKLKKSITTLIDVLRDFDQIGLITYNSKADTIFSSVSLSDKEAVKREINSLTPSGLTYGVKGIEAAYELIQGSFLSEGNNQIILATDGLFTEDHLTLNEQELLRVVRRNNKEYGIKLSVLGFGNDANGLDRMENLTVAGDGNYLEISLDHDAEHSKEILIEEIKTQSRIK